jgi:hypothetical protein
MSKVTDIYDFIKNTFTEDIYENCKDSINCNKPFGGKYNVFLSHNKICLDELNKKDLEYLYIIQKKIKNGEIKNAFTLYFDITDEFIIY